MSDTVEFFEIQSDPDPVLNFRIRLDCDQRWIEFLFFDFASAPPLLIMEIFKSASALTLQICKYYRKILVRCLTVLLIERQYAILPHKANYCWSYSAFG